ncbi:MAG: hypothetical protein OXU75_00360 [Deltaproteobacteria bacterium]|nr:hypothetical protein [Deltaproteobacteria bacterium]
MDRIDELERKKAEAARVTSVEQSVKSIQESPSILNPSIGLSIDTTFQHRGDSDGEFRLRTVELGLSAEVDPYARAYTFITGSEAGVEIEEAAVQTTALPINVTAGRFFADFGRLAQFHQHELPFVNAPLSLSRMVGGEALGTGVQWRYLFPTPFYLALTGGAFNEIGHVHAHAADEHGHEGEEHEEEGEEHDEEGEEHEEEGEEHDEEGEEHDEEGEEHDEEGEDHAEEGTSGGSRFLNNLTYLGRLHAYFDLSETWNLEVGSSLAFTPRMETEEPDEEPSERSLLGIDVTLRHRPLVADFYEGFTIAGEWFTNRQTFHEVGQTTARGGYAYAEVNLNPEVQGRWSLGLLLDSAPDLENPSDTTLSLSPYISWSPSEFNRLRLQYTHGRDEVGEVAGHDGAQFYLQWTTVLGSHTHGFRERR